MRLVPSLHYFFHFFSIDRLLTLDHKTLLTFILLLALGLLFLVFVSYLVEFWNAFSFSTLYNLINLTSTILWISSFIIALGLSNSAIFSKPDFGIRPLYYLFFPLDILYTLDPLLLGPDFSPLVVVIRYLINLTPYLSAGLDLLCWLLGLLF